MIVFAFNHIKKIIHNPYKWWNFKNTKDKILIKCLKIAIGKRLVKNFRVVYLIIKCQKWYYYI